MYLSFKTQYIDWCRNFDMSKDLVCRIFGIKSSLILFCLSRGRDWHLTYICTKRPLSIKGLTVNKGVYKHKIKISPEAETLA